MRRSSWLNIAVTIRRIFSNIPPGPEHRLSTWTMTFRGEEKTERFLELETVQRRTQAERWKRYVGKTLEVLVEKGGARSATSDLGTFNLSQGGQL